MIFIDVGYDASGNGNNWTANNINNDTTSTSTDVMVDSPTRYGTDTGAGGEVRGNYCTWNPLTDVSSLVISNGNLTVTSTVDDWPVVTGTLGVSSGKYYYEISTTDQTRWGAGWSTKEFVTGSTFANSIANAYLAYSTDPLSKYDLGSSTNPINGSPAFTPSDILQIAIDVDAGKIWYGIDNVWVNDGAGNAGNPATGANPVSTFTAGTQMFPTVVVNRADITANFGQRPFAYTAPSGFKALCTTNLPTPTIADGGEYFNALTYTGDGNNPRTVTGVGFNPDFVWIKSRSLATSHLLNDVIRGGNASLFSESTAAETANNGGGYLSAFATDGFTVTAGGSGDNAVNNTSDTYVAWNWKANGSGVSNTAGSISSTVSVNTTAGFSIVGYASGAAGQKTVGHGLGVAPSMIITKSRSSASFSWAVYHSSVCDTTSKFLRLNTTDAIATFSTIWGAALPTSTVFGITSNGGVVENTNCIAYCFAPVAGYSAFGKYTGNGLADGPFVYTGFRPRYVMVKRTDIGGAGFDWFIWDTARDTYNQMASNLTANQSVAEGVTAYPLDALSNGFKVRNSATAYNASGGTYIYMAFAENPFKLALAR